MAVKTHMPKLGMTMKKGKVAQWLKEEGDSVEKGEILFVVETEKVSLEIESPASGVLFQILVQAGETVQVGTVTAIIAEKGETPERMDAAVIDDEAMAQAEAGQAAAESRPSKETRFIKASPAAKRLARELAVDLSCVQATGTKGRVTEADVQRYHEEGPPAPRITPLAKEMAAQEGIDFAGVQGTGEGGKILRADIENAMAASVMTVVPEKEPAKSVSYEGMRKAIGDNLHASLQNTAQVTIMAETDVTEMVRIRDQVLEEYKGDRAVKISYNDILVFVVSRVLKGFPLINSTFEEEKIMLHDSVNMGIAVSVPDGLMVPVIRNTDQKGLLRIAREARGLAKKARDGSIGYDDMAGGTFTISSVYMFQVDGVTPILKSPETCILGAGRVKLKPAEYKGEIALRSLMTLSLTFDHRIVDGAMASQFVETVGRYLERPYVLMG